MHVYKNIKFESFQGFTKLSDYIFMSTHLNDEKTYFDPVELLYKISKLFTYFFIKKADKDLKINNAGHIYIFCQPVNKIPKIGLVFNVNEESYIISESSLILNSNTAKELKENDNLNTEQLFERFETAMELALKLFQKCHEHCSHKEKDKNKEKDNLVNIDSTKNENKFDKSNYIQL